MLLLLMSMILMPGMSTLNEGPLQDVEKVVRLYVEYGDAQNATSLTQVMSNDFRIVWHDGESENNLVIPKAAYLEKIRSKEWGGEKRSVTVQNARIIDSANATFEITLESEKSTMKSFFSLVNSGGTWVIVQELVTAEFR